MGEAVLCGLPKGLGSGMAGVSQGFTEVPSCGAGTQREGLPSGIRRQESRAPFGYASETSCEENENSLRFGESYFGYRGQGSNGNLRDDGLAVQLSLALHGMEQPVNTSDRAKQGIYLPEHPSGVLWDECGAGELGGRGAKNDARRLVKDGDVGDEPKIAEIFGAIIEASVERRRFAGVRADLETLGYACGGGDLCAAGVGAPHARQRIYWVANASSSEWGPLSEGRHVNNGSNQRREKTPGGYTIYCASDRIETMANANGSREHERTSSWQQSVCDGVCSSSEGMGDPACAGLEGERSEYRPSGERHSGLVGFAMQTGVPQWNGPTVAVECSDGSRRVSAQPNSFPLAHGVSGRMGRLRGYGNAIVPQVAAQFIGAMMDCLP